MAAHDEMNLGRWLLRGSPSTVLLAFLTETILHFGFRVSWTETFYPALLLIGIYTVLQISLYYGRKRPDGSYDLRLGVGVFGILSWITGLLGMWYAENLGIAGPGVFARNCRLFSIFMAIATLLAVALVWTCGRHPNAALRNIAPR
jgi:hypothetical protein